MKRSLSLILAVIMLFALVACGEKKTDGTTQAQEKEPASADVDASAVIYKSEHYTITVAEFQYFMAKVYDDFATPYGEMINYMLDTSKPLREQTCPVDQSGNTTWFDYVADGAVTTIKDYILLAEEAHANGYALSEEDTKLIEDELAALDTKAVEAGFATTGEYIRAYYGSLSTKDSLRTCFTLAYLANKYRAEKYNALSYTDEEYLAYADANPSDCYYADFMFLRIPTEFEQDATEEEKNAAWEKTKATAIAFNNAVNGKESFFAEAEKYMRSVSTIVENEEDANAQNNIFTEEGLQTAVSSTEVVGKASYNTGAENYDWIFAEGRLAGEQTVIENEESYTCEIIYMLKPKYLSEAATVDIRHIYFSPNKEGDEYKAQTKAEAVRDEWTKGEADEEAFATLASKYTADTETITSGGLYQAVVKGDKFANMPELEEWFFAPERASGDTEIIKTDYGYHFVYFVDHGLPRWKNTADTKLREASMTAYMTELEKKITIELNEDNIDKCPDLFEQ